MGLPPSRRVSRVRRYSGYSQVVSCFAYRALTFFGTPFQVSSTTIFQSFYVSPLPRTLNIRFGLLPLRSPLLGQSFIYFLFLSVLRCFSSRGSLHYTMCSCNDTHILIWVRSRIRTSTDLCSFAAPRSFSQLVTSFFGAWCQGILRTLFFRLVIRVFLTRLPSGNKKTFVSVLVLLHCKTFTSILFLRTKSFTSFYAYYSFSLFLLSIVSISYSRYTLCSCQCAKLSATLCRLSRPERDSLISIALFIGQVKRFY